MPSTLPVLRQRIQEGIKCSFSRIDGSGRINSNERNEKVEQVKLLIDDNNSSSTRVIAYAIDITLSMAQRILSESLEKTWIHSWWVPHQLCPHNRAV